MNKRYEHQGEFEQELYDKIKTGIQYALKDDSQLHCVSSDITDLILIALNSSKHYEESAELVNSRTGQYIASYLPDDVSSFPEHIQKEVALIRN